MDEHLGYEKYQAEGRDGENSHTGRPAKTVLTEIGPVTIEVPRDTESTFEPQIAKKRQRVSCEKFTHHLDWTACPAPEATRIAVARMPGRAQTSAASRHLAAA